MILRNAVEAATWAPSLHNTQPWSFTIDGDQVGVRPDLDRLLPLADQGGRQMLISCGAAIFNLRTSLGAAGRLAVTELLPDPEQPELLATVTVGEEIEPDRLAVLLSAEIERRRTHRAGFTDLPVPDPLIEAMIGQAAEEGVRLAPVRAVAALQALSALTEAAQAVQKQNPAVDAELDRWTRPPGSTRGDGVPAAATALTPSWTVPAFAQREYPGARKWARDSENAAFYNSTGLVIVMTTLGDGPADWIATGQALQAILLHASAYGVSAAFHTQSLERPGLRAFIREDLCEGEYPQMIIRMGIVFDDTPSVRRDLSEMLDGTKVL